MRGHTPRSAFLRSMPRGRRAPNARRVRRADGRRSTQVSLLAVVALVPTLLVAEAMAPPASAGPLGEVLIGCSGVGLTATATDLAAFRQAIIDANATAGPDTIRLGTACTYSFTDAYTTGGSQTSWYGPAALPAISSDVTIKGDGATIQRDPATAQLFRFFFVGADPANSHTPNYATPGAGTLTLQDLTLKDGGVHGGNGGTAGGGGAGMGGSIFNQGQVTLDRVTIDGSLAKGGDGQGLFQGSTGGGHGGGIGQSSASGNRSGGFGSGFTLPVSGSSGGAGGASGGGLGDNAGSGGGGGGFRPTENGGGGSSPGAGGAGGPSGAQTGTGGVGGAIPGQFNGGTSGDGSGGGGAAASGNPPFIAGGAGGSGGGFGFGGGLGGNGTGGINPASPAGGGGGGGVGGGGGGGGNGATPIGGSGDTGGAGGAGGGGGFGGGGGPGGVGGNGSDMGAFGNDGDGGRGGQGGGGGFGGGGGGGANGGDPGHGGAGGAYGVGGTGGGSGFGGGAGSPGFQNWTGAGGGGAGMGGAIFNQHGQLTLHNTTFSGNTAEGGAGGGSTLLIAGAGGAGQGLGGAIFNLNGTVAIDSSTIAFNTAAEGGGGIYNLGYLGADGANTYAATVTMVNSILSNTPTTRFGNTVADVMSDKPTTVSTGAANVVPATVDVTDHNIVMVATALGAGTISGTPLTVDPQLNPTLAGNTPSSPSPAFTPPATHAIDASSPAYNAGATSVGTDERGVPRPALGQDDIGAFEFTLITPTLTLASVPTSAGLGDTARAVVTMSGGSQTSGNVTFTLFDPADADCTGPPLSTSTMRLAGGTAFGDSPALTAFGTHRWRASYTGDSANYPVLSPCGAATVVVGKATPNLFADALPTVAALGDPIQDAAIVDGYNATGAVTFDLYGPADPTCTSAPVFTSTKTIGPSSTLSDTYTPTVAGLHRWIATYHGDADNNAVAGPCADPRQAVAVAFKPTLVTQAVPTVAAVGDVIHADATLVGGVNPTGTVTFNLYAPTDDRCYTSRFTSTVAISPAGTATSDPYTLAAASGLFENKGTYRWLASYSGDANNPASIAQTCGALNQTVEVGKATPMVTGAATPSLAAVGTGVRDVATFTNLVSPSGNVAFELYNDPACAIANRVGASNININTVEQNVAGAWVVTSGSMGPGEGTYYWRVIYDGDGDNNAVSTPCGAAHQTVTLGKLTPSLTITNVIPTAVHVGETVHATAVLGGGALSGRVSFTAYGPDAPGSACNPNSGNIVLFSPAIDGNGESGGGVDGDGTYTSGDFTPSAPGIYRWRVHYTADNTLVNSADEACGPSGDLTVTAAPVTGISGVVTDQSTSAPLGGIVVTLMRAQPSWVIQATTTTDADGHYSFTGLPNGGYGVRFFDGTGGHERIWYNAKRTYRTADVLTVASPSDVITANQGLSAASTGSISGRAQTGARAGIAGIQVYLFTASSGYYASTVTGADGYYRFGAVPAGDYYIQFVDPAHRYRSQWFDFKLLFPHAGIVTVGSGVTWANALLG